MKRIFFLMIIFVIIMSLGVAVYAANSETWPENKHNYPYIIILHTEIGEHSIEEEYKLIYSSKPYLIVSTDFYEDGTGYLWMGADGKCNATVYKKRSGNEEWEEHDDYENGSIRYICTDIGYANYTLGYATTTFELEENQSSFFGIDFDYSGFWGDLKLQIGKKEEKTGNYKILKEWQYPKGSGHVSIPASEIPQGNKGEYVIIVYEGDTIIQQFPYNLNVKEKESYCEINYPVNGMNYDYFPNVNIRYYDMGRLYIYINGEMYKQIQTKDREGIEVVSGKVDLFDIGLNTVTVMNSSGQDVATVQYMVLREGPDPLEELPEFEAESWVQELFNRIMNEYSMFFEYVKSMYAFLPVEIIGLVGVIMMLSVILWFTGRK